MHLSLLRKRRRHITIQLLFIQLNWAKFSIIGIKSPRNSVTVAAPRSGSPETFTSSSASFQTSYHLLTLSRWRWLEERYVAIKINANRRNSPAKASEGELGILRHISKANPRHKGWHFVRKLLNSFTLDGVSGKHQSLVFEPLREPLWLYRERFIGNVIPPEILKIMLQMVLHGLDYLHSECHVIHTGTYSPFTKDSFIDSWDRFEA
jgi:hypothetical protein